MGRCVYALVVVVALVVGMMMSARGAIASGVPGDVDCNVIEYLLTRPEDFSITSDLTAAAAVYEPDFYAAGANASIPFTFFAPTNGAWEAAFTALDRTVAQASKSINLHPVLSYHVVPGAVLAEDLEFGQVIETFTPGGDTITAELVTFGPYVAGAITPVFALGDVKVIEKDIQCGAAVVHVIDNVLVPQLVNPEADYECNPLEYIKSIPELSITATAFELDEANFPDLYAGAGNASTPFRACCSDIKRFSRSMG